MTDNQHSRRRFLISIAGGAATLAGCSNTSSPDTDSSEVFTDLRTEGTALRVSLSESATVGQISILTPNGAEFLTKEVEPGVTRVPVQLPLDYEPGTYEVVASAEGDVVGRSTIELQPEMNVVDISVGANVGDRPEELPYAEEQLMVTVENAGTGPTALTELAIDGAVPNPTEEQTKRKSGIYYDGSPGPVESVTLPVGETRVLWSTTMPFAFAGNEFDCPTQEQTRDISIDIDLSTGASRSISIKAVYQTGENGDCKVTIRGGE